VQDAELATVMTPATSRATAGGTERATSETERGRDAVPSATLDVRIVSSAHGGRLADVDVLAYERGDFEPGDRARRRVRATSDLDGHIRFELEAGVPWALDVDPTEEYGYSGLDVEPLAPGEEREVELRLPTSGDVLWFGRVTLRREPFAGAHVLVYDLTDDDTPRFLEETESDPTGIVRLTGSSWIALEVRVRYVGEAQQDLAIQALQDGVAVTFIATGRARRPRSSRCPGRCSCARWERA